MTATLPLEVDSPQGLADDLGRFGDAVALVGTSGSLTYAELEARVAAAAACLGTTRRLVVVVAENSIESVVVYLAALRGRHPVILASPSDDAARRALVERYQPDLIADEGGLTVCRDGSPHDLHPDLALLLSTSGSTGTPKLVRLSHDNIVRNAAAIAEALGIRADDRAITTLPMHYCYGLSVLNSYLQVGASVVLSELSVVDERFWTLARNQRVTSFAGVPHTFDLLDRIGFTGREIPSLRYLTQAGGRMPRERVKRYAELGGVVGFDFVVMYGQTEATARMAYLPPTLAGSHPGAIGVAVPGGELRVDAPDDHGVGELVYRGANVMLGYAHGPEDLAAGRIVGELRTGDLARRTRDGVFEIVGRSSRIVKPFGVRIDLDDLERVLFDHDVTALCTGDDDQLVVGVTREAAAPARATIEERLRLPISHFTIVEFDQLPRLPNGKADYASVRVAAAAVKAAAPAASVRSAFVAVLGRDARSDDSFVGLDGDSLSYVEMSIALEEQIGELPRDWHLMSVGALELLATPHKRGFWTRVDTTLALRAIAVVLIVANHTRWLRVPGGAHTLMVVAGFNFARFQLTSRAMWPSVAKIAIPSIACITAVAAFSDRFFWSHAVLLNGVFGPDGSRYAYWFVESLVQILLVLAVAFAVPAVGRFERRRPMLVAYVAVAAGLCARFNLFEPSIDHTVRWRPQDVFWFFALGWAAARAPSVRHRRFITLVTAACLPGFFGDSRGFLVGVAIAAVVWLPTIKVPRVALRFMTPLAAASLYIYLTHIPLYMALYRAGGPALATIGSLVAGVVAWRIARRIEVWSSPRLGRLGWDERTRNATGKTLTISNAKAGSAAAS